MINNQRIRTRLYDLLWLPVDLAFRAYDRQAGRRARAVRAPVGGAGTPEPIERVVTAADDGDEGRQQ